MIFMIINRKEIVIKLHIRKTTHGKEHTTLSCWSVDISGVTLNVNCALLTKTTLEVGPAKDIYE